jgi:hypothetical protein
MNQMNQLSARLLWGGALVLQSSLLVSACSDDDGADVRPKDPNAQAGAGGGGAAGTGGGGGMGGGGTGGGGGNGGEPPDAGDMCRPVFLDAGVFGDAGSIVDAGTAADAGDAGSSDAGALSSNGALSFARDVHPIFRELCTPCHATDFSGGHNIAAADVTEAFGVVDDASDYVRESLLERLSSGSMPPDCNGQPPGSPGCIGAQQYDLVRRWVAQCFPP